VLTTHSIDEAETLSTKLGILVTGGILKCFGTASHIRKKFCRGVHIEIKIHSPCDVELPKKVRDFLDPTLSRVADLS
jgi:ATP-binding cassette, subfamily A (ABC1), member 3